MRLPTESEVAEINSAHFADTPLKPADLLYRRVAGEAKIMRLKPGYIAVMIPIAICQRMQYSSQYD
jgi:hypothetical protein